MNSKNITRCLIIICISLMSIILYDFEYYYYGKREGAIFTIIAGIIFLVAKLALFMIPLTTYQLLFAIALTIAVEVPMGVYRAKDRQTRLREQRAQLDGVNQTSYIMILEEGEGDEEGQAFRYPVKVPSFKCTDDNIIKSKCKTFQCQLPYIPKEKRRMVPPPISSSWEKDKNGKIMRTIKKISSIDKKWNTLLDCYAAT